MGHTRQFVGATYHLVSVKPLIINHGDEEAISLRRIRMPRAEARFLNETARTWRKVLDIPSLVVKTCQSVEALI